MLDPDQYIASIQSKLETELIGEKRFHLVTERFLAAKNRAMSLLSAQELRDLPPIGFGVLPS